MGAYKHKDPVEMQRTENQKRIRLEAELLKQRLLNEILKEHEDEFEAAVATGGLASIEPPEAIGKLFRTSARRQLGSGDAEDA